MLWGFLYYVISILILFLPRICLLISFLFWFLFVFLVCVNVCVRALFCWYTFFFFFPLFLSPEEPIGMFYMGRCSIYTSLSLSNWNSNKKKSRTRDYKLSLPQIFFFPFPASSKVSLLLPYYHNYHNFEKYTILIVIPRFQPLDYYFFFEFYLKHKKFKLCGKTFFSLLVRVAVFFFEREKIIILTVYRF